MKKAYVYFLASEQGFLKIGCSTDPFLRFGDHCNQLAPRIGKLTFLGAVEGTMKDELFALKSLVPVKATRFHAQWTFLGPFKRSANYRRDLPLNPYSLGAGNIVLAITGFSDSRLC